MSGERRPEIEYPVRWTYKVIGEDADRLRGAIEEAVVGTDHSITPSNTSREGRFVSMTLEVLVAGEGQRDRIFAALGDHGDVRVVI